ncbi:MAG TPA: transglutaminase-like domain-containing protein [Candidatus Edwardsbacteria bacterium]|nr:transglutaminase-like domain-containing protein [Candidatus Edwardsbacteria bacterium]
MKTTSSIKSLIRKGRLFATQSDYHNAFSTFQQAAELQSRQSQLKQRGWTLAAAAYMAILDGQIPEGLDLLLKAASAGYADVEKMDALARTEYCGKPLRSSRSFKTLYARVHKNATPLEVSECYNQQCDAWEWMRFCQAKDLGTLRKHIPRFADATEWRQCISCLDWTHHRFKHDAVNKAGSYDPLTIFRESQHQKRFTCQEYAVLLAAVLQAHGHPARVIVLLKNGYQYGSGKGHWVAEVWSDHFNKWVLLDPQNNCYWKYGNMTLNAAEIRDLLVSNKTKHIKAFSRGKESGEMESWLDHFHAVWYYRNQDYFKRWRTDGDVEELSNTPQLLFQDKPRQRFNHHRTPDRLYPAMNKLNFQCAVGKEKLRIELNNSCVYFGRYECTINGAAWKPCASPLVLPLKRGLNWFLFRARDIYDRVTIPVGITVRSRV